jgi:hypothetical protein
MGTPLPPLTLPTVKPIKRIFPHVDEIADAPTKQTVALLWERVHNLEERLQQVTAANTALLGRITTHDAAIATAQGTAEHALLAIAASADGSGGGADGGGSLPGGGDGGAGAEGFAAAGPTGHDTGGLLTANRAGQIIGGTAHEWSGLLQPVATQAIRTANMAEMLSRMIWHLQQAGFTAGKQKNPSGAISGDKLTFEDQGVLRTYDVMSDRPFATTAVDVHMNEVGGPQLVADAGTPD